MERVRRGSVKLVQGLFGPEEAVMPEGDGRGRNDALAAMRNELLLYRYWYYMKHKNYRYDFALHRLEREFYVSQRRIIDLLDEEHDQLVALRSEQPTIAVMRQRWPHWVW